jgi:hypothetical protein
LNPEQRAFLTTPAYYIIVKNIHGGGTNLEIVQLLMEWKVIKGDELIERKRLFVRPSLP